MKLMKLFVLILISGTILNAQDKGKTAEQTAAPKPAASMLKTFDDSVSYSIGQNIGSNLKDPSMNINFDILVSGMKDAKDGSSLLVLDEMKSVMNKFNEKLTAKRTADMKAIAEKNKKTGDEFLTENKKKEGVTTTPSGLQYKVLVKGNGPSPADTSTVKVHYRGTLIDGKEFDSSYKRGEPAEFPVTGVIKGWTEALKMMHVGDKWELYIPSDLAYGEQGAGNGAIEPNAVLIFEVELLDIVKK